MRNFHTKNDEFYHKFTFEKGKNQCFFGPKKDPFLRGRPGFSLVRNTCVFRDHFFIKSVENMHNAVTNNSPIFKENGTFLDYTLGKFSGKKCPI